MFPSHLCSYCLLNLLIATENGNMAKAHPQVQSQIDTPSGPICQASVKEMSKAMTRRRRTRTRTKTRMKTRTRTRTKDVHTMVHHSRTPKPSATSSVCLSTIYTAPDPFANSDGTVPSSSLAFYLLVSVIASPAISLQRRIFSLSSSCSRIFTSPSRAEP